jgi:hypothetical protein
MFLSTERLSARAPLSRNSGVARVSAVWLIVLVVLFLVSIAFAFIAQSDLAAAEDARAQALSDRDAANSLAETESQSARAISVAVGWIDAESANPRTDIEAMNRVKEDLASTFADLGVEDKTFDVIARKITASYNARGREIAELKSRVQTLESEVSVAGNTLRQVTSDKDQQIAALSQQLADEQQNAQRRQSDLEDRVAAANSQLSERDLELRTARAEAAAEKRQADLEMRGLGTRIADLSEKTAFAREPFSNYPDGAVIDVSDELSLGWIDIGANNRLTRGVRFRVESGTPGVERYKAMAEVTDVKANMAEVVFYDLVDRFDPVVAGDVIINPLFDPSGGRNAVLIGRFSGSFNEKELGLLLGRMAINVQPDLDLTTHFLIVGAELYTDPETGEPLEDPIQPSELATYKDAEAKGVQIIPIQDIRQFFKLDLSPKTSGM